ncbi:MAG: signal peptidase I [Planctomycetes bacterium]|nr:signal peptidase I [Planctomycetota bacterium]
MKQSVRRRRRRRAVWVALGALLFAGALVRPYRVVGASMEPRFQDGQLVWTVPLWRAPERGEVVVFEAPDGSGRSMKRVAGLPGELAERMAARLQPDPDRPPIETSALRWGSEGAGRDPLPQDSFFLLGDHLADSIDSRHYGPVPGGALRRRVLGAQ